MLDFKVLDGGRTTSLTLKKVRVVFTRAMGKWNCQIGDNYALPLADYRPMSDKELRKLSEDALLQYLEGRLPSVEKIRSLDKITWL